MKNVVNGIYVCKLCGNISELIVAGEGEMVCCGEPMVFMTENTVDASKEKHVPVVEDLGNGKVKVIVGSVAHPMMAEHYIMFIEAVAKDGTICRKNLNPGEAPEAVFNVAAEDLDYVREYCNLHGLWKK